MVEAFADGSSRARRGEITSRRFGRRIVVLRQELERVLGPYRDGRPFS